MFVCIHAHILVCDISHSEIYSDTFSWGSEEPDEFSTKNDKNILG